MKKAFTKRIKITKKGKMLYRRAGQNHFNAKESTTARRRKKALLEFPDGLRRRMRAYQHQ